MCFLLLTEMAYRNSKAWGGHLFTYFDKLFLCLDNLFCCSLRDGSLYGKKFTSKRQNMGKNRAY